MSIINESQIWWLISPDFKACTVFAMNFALNLARQFCVVARWGVVDYSARHLYGLYGESLYRYNCIRQTGPVTPTFQVSNVKLCDSVHLDVTESLAEA